MRERQSPSSGKHPRPPAFCVRQALYHRCTYTPTTSGSTCVHTPSVLLPPRAAANRAFDDVEQRMDIQPNLQPPSLQDASASPGRSPGPPLPLPNCSLLWVCNAGRLMAQGVKKKNLKINKIICNWSLGTKHRICLLPSHCLHFKKPGSHCRTVRHAGWP